MGRPLDTPLPQPNGTIEFGKDKTQVLTGDDTHGMVDSLDTVASKVGSGASRSDFGALGGILKLLGSILVAPARFIWHGLRRR